MNKWQNFLKKVLLLLNIDKVLNKEEFKYALNSLKDNNQLNQFLEVLSDKKKKSQKPCPDCGSNLAEILKKDKINCKKCKSHFAEFLVSFLGKDSVLLDLQIKIRKAIQEEKYEEAAVFRDQIKKLEV